MVNQKTQIVEGVYGESAAVSMIKADGISAGFIVVFLKTIVKSALWRVV